MNKKDERLERSGLLCRIPVAVRTELGSDVSLPTGGLSPESQCPRLLGEALVFTGEAPVGRPAGMAAAGPASLGRWHCLGLQWDGAGVGDGLGEREGWTIYGLQVRRQRQEDRKSLVVTQKLSFVHFESLPITYPEFTYPT